ncbi:hypothetical protein XELAEV_18010640mg [Xenopus laevis]|uniref:Uncharacterized protein n=1 Tax=Xenopus laevis TaxID=8355 RepID=A0A974DUW7_XENLA|nr:hypothetical protein XELAEV_18010640mg [Xenopus laevis]
MLQVTNLPMTSIKASQSCDRAYKDAFCGCGIQWYCYSNISLAQSQSLGLSKYMPGTKLVPHLGQTSTK